MLWRRAGSIRCTERKRLKLIKLKREVENIIKQISATHYQNVRTGSELVLEAYCLNADKTLLEVALPEIQVKVKLDLLHVIGLLSELADSKQNREILMVDHERVLKMLEGIKSNEEKLENTVTRHKLILKANGV
ncbi:hypothetical protein FEM48_Zijuj03G0049800 [Ziziphus jujuba var. spinosa]|uniref:Uncharacterized protein n=1 Tax=Ziziphus jujuba var. spinosa TaxID=714518 RepID=A0A978VNB2_ZIZJJ|nr:hypothetical protein FEM48_Zijuj03G0049800 [Ziziphus jujuba var. spinosa]